MHNMKERLLLICTLFLLSGYAIAQNDLIRNFDVLGCIAPEPTPHQAGNNDCPVFRLLAFSDILPTDKDDIYGQYCGACRINGLYFPDGQTGWKEDEIGAGAVFWYYDEQNNLTRGVGPEPDNAFDRCCMDHDKCLARADQKYCPCSDEYALAVKQCDLVLSGCWAKAHAELGFYPTARLKTAIAIPVMIVVAHPKETGISILSTVVNVLEAASNLCTIKIEF